MKRISVLMIFVLAISGIFLQGCATNKPLAKTDMLASSTLRVVRQETPIIKIRTLGRAFVYVLAGPLSEAGSTSREENTQAQIPDMGYLVMNKFTERASREVAGWPAMTVINQPMGENHTETGTLLEFKIERLLFAFIVGIRAESVVTMMDSQGNVLWQKKFTYLSSDFNRKKGIEEYEADNYKLLKEEIEFAADKTVSDFIDHLKNGA